MSGQKLLKARKVDYNDIIVAVLWYLVPSYILTIAV